MKNLIIAFLLIFSFSLNAQHLEVGLSFGNANYLGDLVGTKDLAVLKQFNAATGVFGRYNHKRFSVKASLMHTTLKADDINGINPERGLSFKTPVTELGLSTDIGLTYFKFNYGKSYIEPYATAGIALYRFNPKTLNKGQWVELQPLGTEGQGLEGHENPYNRVQLALVAGGGIKYKINKNIAIRAEMGFRKLFTDHLDDVSGAEVNYTDLIRARGSEVANLSTTTIKAADRENPAYTYRRGGDAADMYFVYQISVSYTIGKDKKHNISF